jgi:hypothetical protein
MSCGRSRRLGRIILSDIESLSKQKEVLQAPERQRKNAKHLQEEFGAYPSYAVRVKICRSGLGGGSGRQVKYDRICVDGYERGLRT